MLVVVLLQVQLQYRQQLVVEQMLTILLLHLLERQEMVLVQRLMLLEELMVRCYL